MESTRRSFKCISVSSKSIISIACFDFLSNLGKLGQRIPLTNQYLFHIMCSSDSEYQILIIAVRPLSEYVWRLVAGLLVRSPAVPRTDNRQPPQPTNAAM